MKSDLKGKVVGTFEFIVLKRKLFTLLRAI